jgi:hypothetical protein
MTFDSSKLRIILIFAVAICVSLYLGIGAATAQGQTIVIVLGTALFLTCVFMGRSIWLLIPFCSALSISLRIPGQPDTLLLAQILVISFCALLFLMRRLPFMIQFTELEFWMLVMVACVAQVYIRNPVGINILGGDTVGGKGYFLFGLAVVTAFILSIIRVREAELRWLLPLSIIGGCFNAGISVLGNYVSAIGFYTGAVATRTDVVDYTKTMTAVDAGAATRIVFLTTLGKNLSLWVSAFKSPIRACFHPLWLCLILVSMAAVMLGGFRAGVAFVGLNYLVAIAYRSGTAGILLASLGGCLTIGVLAFVNLIAPLPPNVQRTLTFLPGTWEQRYKDDAEGSTDWRVEIWKEALFSERWIQNKIMGDGLGFSAAELAAQMNAVSSIRVGVSGFDVHRESVLANGDYHSGPVSTVRVIGYVGLIFFLAAQIRLAVHAHRQILRCRGTEWLPLSLFIGIPLIIAPIIFVFLFGDFKQAASLFLISSGMVRLLENNLPLPKYADQTISHALMTVNNRKDKEFMPSQSS